MIEAPTKSCAACRNWSREGQRHPDAPPGLWGLCLAGLPGWAHADFICERYITTRIKRETEPQTQSMFEVAE